MIRSISIALGLTLFLAGCEAVPVFDPANYYAASRYYDKPLPSEKAFWQVGGKAKDAP